MARIISYPPFTPLDPLTNSDLLIVSDVSSANTKSLKIGELSTHIIVTNNIVTGTGTTDFVVKFTDGPNGVIGDSTINDTAGETIFTQDTRFDNAVLFDGGTVSSFQNVEMYDGTPLQFVDIAGPTVDAQLSSVAGSGKLNIDGSLQFDDYGSGTITGTAAYNLSVDASGNVIETASGGGGGCSVGGSGTINTLPKWTAADTLGDSIIRQSPSNPQVFISTDPAYVSSGRLDVDGTTRTKSLNVSSGKFFVNVQAGFSYIQANNYGQGNYFTTGQAVNQPKYIPAFGDTGKIIESSRYKTIAITNTDATTGRLANGTVTGFTGTNNAPTSITLDVDSGTINIGDVIQVAQNAYVPNIIVAGVTPNGGVSFTVTFTGWPGGSGVQVFIGNYIQFLTFGFDGVEIIPSPGQGSFNYVQELLFFYDNNGGQYNFAPNPGGNFKEVFIIKYADAPAGTLVKREITNVDSSPFVVANEDWYMNLNVLTVRTQPGGATQLPWTFKNRAVLLQTDNIRGTTGGGSPVSYIRIKYCVLNDDYSWIFNSDQIIS